LGRVRVTEERAPSAPLLPVDVRLDNALPSNFAFITHCHFETSSRWVGLFDLGKSEFGQVAQVVVVVKMERSHITLHVRREWCE